MPKTLFTHPVGGSLGKRRQDSGSSRRFWRAADLALAEPLGREKEDGVLVLKGNQHWCVSSCAGLTHGVNTLQPENKMDP